MARRRLDQELVRRGLATSRTEASGLIERGEVLVAGVPASKAASLVDPSTPLLLRGRDERYASRGAHKLIGALTALHIDARGRRVLDAGASTGGFTDVLLRRGARTVIAVDVGYGQLAYRLRIDPRVIVLERTNVRYLEPEQLAGGPVDLVVADLSFISLSTVLPALRRCALPHATFLLLCKPQFEAGPEQVGKGGVVRDPAAWRSAVERLLDAGWGAGLGTLGVAVSPLPGPAGNIEFFVSLGESGVPPTSAQDAVDAAMTAGKALRAGSMTP